MANLFWSDTPSDKPPEPLSSEPFVPFVPVTPVEPPKTRGRPKTGRAVPEVCVELEAARAKWKEAIAGRGPIKQRIVSSKEEHARRLRLLDNYYNEQKDLIDNEWKPIVAGLAAELERQDELVQEAHTEFTMIKESK